MNNFNLNNRIKVTIVVMFVNFSCANAQSIIVNNTANFIKYVTQPSQYNTVIVQGPITNVPNILLRDNLNILGYDNNSAIIMAKDIQGNLLTTGHDDVIKNITIMVNSISNNFAISNNQGQSFGKLIIDNVTTNGEINLHLTDSSQDSMLNISKMTITLNQMGGTVIDDVPAAMHIVTENNSSMTIKDIASNTINAIGTPNLGIYIAAYNTSLISIDNIYANNISIKASTMAPGIFLFADTGTIMLKQNISNNMITINSNNSPAIINDALNQGTIKIQGSMNSNIILSNNYYSNDGIVTIAENNSKVIYTSTISNNNIVTNGVGSIDFVSCTGQCDTYALPPYSGLIDYSQAQIFDNTMTANYDDTVNINNFAYGVGSLINFGFGNEGLVSVFLTNSNHLKQKESMLPNVYNAERESGVIR